MLSYNICKLAVDEIECSVKYKCNTYCKDCVIGFYNYYKLFLKDTNISSYINLKKYKEMDKSYLKYKCL